MITELEIAAVATELAYGEQTVGNSTDEMPGYVVDRVFDDQWSNTGFYAVGFFNEALGHRIVGIRGTQDRLDIVADADLGINQYVANRGQMLDYVGAGILGSRITIAGHSLGGCLSQYLAYDAAQAFPAGRERLVVHTQNGLGGVLGIIRMRGKYDRAVVEGVTFRNYRHPDDPVSRLGGQMGGSVYVLPSPPVPTGGLHFVHSNLRFMPQSGASILAGAVEASDEAFSLAETLQMITPGVSRAVAEILDDHAVIRGVCDLYRMIRLVPTAERGEVMRLVAALLPFHGRSGLARGQADAGQERPAGEPRPT